MKKKVWKGIEFILLFFGIPLFIYFDQDFIHPSIIVIPVLVFVFWIMLRTTTFKWRELFHWGISRKQLWGAVTIYGGLSLLALAWVFFFDRENLFNLPRANPWIYLAMCIFYPVFSAFGQEVIYRTFLFRRYGELFPGNLSFILASGITFSFLHIVYYDPVSMILTLVGGLYFASLYHRTRSVLFTAVLHGAFGIMVFGVGPGQYFWLDIPV